MLSALRQRLLRRWVGDGLGGAVGLSVAAWAWRKLADGVRHDPELLDVSTLKPGEAYTITTRPAPTRRQRKLEKRTSAARSKVERATRTTRTQRRTGRALARARRKAGPAGSQTSSRQAQRAAVLEQRYEALVARSDRQQRLIDSLTALEAELDAERAAQLAAARKKVGRPRRKVWQ